MNEVQRLLAIRQENQKAYADHLRTHPDGKADVPKTPVYPHWPESTRLH
jgi:hypothetical protein